MQSDRSLSRARITPARTSLDPSNAMAHHSVDGQFERSDRVELNGVISKVDWINPHIYLHLDVEEGSGAAVHRA